MIYHDKKIKSSWLHDGENTEMEQLITTQWNTQQKEGNDKMFPSSSTLATFVAILFYVTRHCLWCSVTYLSVPLTIPSKCQ